MGITKSVSNINDIIPPISVQPSGDHNEVPEKVSGIKPTIVKVVRTIGVNLLLETVFIIYKFKFSINIAEAPPPPLQIAAIPSFLLLFIKA